MALSVATSSSTTYASRTNTTITAPTGIANDDILFAGLFVGAATSAPAVTPPTGFAELTNSPSSVTDGTSFNGKFHLYWKRAASESGNYTFSHSAASSQGYMARVSGAITSGSPIDVASTPTTNSGTGSVNLSAVTLANANELVFVIGHNWNGAGTYSGPSGFTTDLNSLVTDSYKIFTSSGSTGTITITNNGNAQPGDEYAYFVVALIPQVSSTYTLTAAQGSLTLTGQAVAFARTFWAVHLRRLKV